MAMRPNTNFSAEFEASCQHPDSYPLNLLRTTSWAHSLKEYNFKLKNIDSLEDLVFDEEYRSVYALDFSDTSKSFSLSQRLTDLASLQELVNLTTEDLQCRFFFIHQQSSRDALGCSKEQMLLILTHHQIMTPFLDHVFTFCERSEPHRRANFSSEDYLSARDGPTVELGNMRRSGLQVQHCFNLVGIEHDAQQASWPYLYRQTAVYYSFDPRTGRSFWMILKGNDVIRHRIQESAHSTTCGPLFGDLSDPESSFSAGLSTHMLINEWSTENLDSYIEFLEGQVSESSSLAKYTNVDGLTQENHIQKGLSKRNTFQSGTQSRYNSGLHQQMNLASRSASWKRMVEVSRKLRVQSGWWRHSSSRSGDAAGVRPKTSLMDDLDIDQIFTFEGLQKVYRLATSIQNAILVLSENKRVLEEMMKRFGDLAKSADFSILIKPENTNLDVFARRTRRCISELENQQARLRILLASLDKDVALFNGILQYKNMRTSEYFAHHAKVSTDRMEDLTVKTKRETVSIHAITILTLFFLPGTFVAVRYGLPQLMNLVSWVLTRCQTFFSSNIVHFGDSTAMWSFGDWTTNYSALKLFGIICGLLTVLVLCAWGLAYCLAQRRQQQADLEMAVPKAEEGGL